MLILKKAGGIRASQGTFSSNTLLVESKEVLGIVCHKISISALSTACVGLL